LEREIIKWPWRSAPTQWSAWLTFWVWSCIATLLPPWQAIAMMGSAQPFNRLGLFLLGMRQPTIQMFAHSDLQMPNHVVGWVVFTMPQRR
jgi:hypothetical protein